MADVVTATVKYTPNGFRESKFPDQPPVCDIKVETPSGNEPNVYAGKGTRQADALWGLSKGEEVQLVKEQGENGPTYNLTDSEIDRILQREGTGNAPNPNGNGGQSQRQQRQRQGGQPQNGNGQTEWSKLSRKQQRRRLAEDILSGQERMTNLAAKTYADLDHKIHHTDEGEERELKNPPTHEDLRNITNTILIHLTDFYLDR